MVRSAYFSKTELSWALKERKIRDKRKKSDWRECCLLLCGWFTLFIQPSEAAKDPRGTCKRASVEIRWYVKRGMKKQPLRKKYINQRSVKNVVKHRKWVRPYKSLESWIIVIVPAPNIDNQFMNFYNGSSTTLKTACEFPHLNVIPT